MISPAQAHPPTGFNIHWSRLVDLPIARIASGLKPWFGQIVAEKAAAAIAPLLPLLVAMMAMALTARRLVARPAFLLAVGLVLCCPTALLMFMPLRVDHHGWQLALLVLAIAGWPIAGAAAAASQWGWRARRRW